ncbi:MAG TPA: hypothetical protein VG106_02325, partial [Vicinamibacterales bacterium]|nr:hypothetical protein [Vicinamibacterales bacterium]
MTRRLFDCDAVLLDMDGTIVDSKAIVERMWTLWAAEHGIPVESALALAHGRRTLETMQLLAPHLATPEEAARLDALARQPAAFTCHVVETEFWGAMATPNLMVESSVDDVAAMITALSFHVGEVQRNPYHLLLTAWMQ